VEQDSASPDLVPVNLNFSLFSANVNRVLLSFARAVPVLLVAS
jgi:hypothetical protein